MAWWRRTGHNSGKGDFLLNDPDGWVIEDPGLHWLGSDQLSLLIGQNSGGRTTAVDVAEPGNSFPAITRATSLICDSLASADWHVVRGREELPSPRWIADPALSRPDGRISDWQPTGRNPLGPVQFWAQAILSALWYGDSFIFVANRDTQGVPIPPLLQLHPLLIDIVGPGRTSAEKPVPGYWLMNPDDDTWHRLEASEVIHIPGMAPYWAGRGRGALTGHMRTWDEAVAQRNYSTGLFTAGIPAGYLKVSTPNLPPDKAEELREKWLEKHAQVPGQRDIAVLNAVTDFVAVQINPEDAQMADARKHSTLDVANAFGVEPYMLGLPSDNATYANIESRMRHFAQFTLLPWARRMEGALNCEFPYGTELRLDLDSMSRADTGTRITYYTAGLEQGWLTKDEVRAAEKLPPLTPEQKREAEPPAPAPAVTLVKGEGGTGNGSQPSEEEADDGAA